MDLKIILSKFGKNLSQNKILRRFVLAFCEQTIAMMVTSTTMTIMMMTMTMMTITMA